MDQDAEPMISANDSVDMLDVDDNYIANYGTFGIDENEGDDYSRDDSGKAHEGEDTDDETQKLVVTGKRGRKRGDSGASLKRGMVIDANSQRDEENVITNGANMEAELEDNQHIEAKTDEDENAGKRDKIVEVMGGALTGDVDDGEIELKVVEDDGEATGEDGDKRQEEKEERHDYAEDSDDVRTCEPENVTMETVISDEDRETDPSTMSAVSEEQEDQTDAAPKRSSQTLAISISMVKMMKATEPSSEGVQKPIPPEQIVLQQLKKEKDSSSCYDDGACKDTEMERVRAYSKNQGHQSISRPKDFHRSGSLFSDPSGRESQALEWEWIEEPDLQDDTDSPDIHMRSFASVHSEPKGFREVGRGVFLPHQKLEVTVVDCGRSSSSQFINPNLYFIEVKHGTCIWTIQRRSNDFLKLHEEMLLYKARLAIPIGDRGHLQRRRTFKANRDRDLAHFPRTPDAFVRAQQLPKRMHQYEVYLKSLVRNPLYRNHPQTLEFLEVSHLSFVDELGPKGKEGWIQKRSGGHRVPITRCCPCLVCTDCTSVAAHYSKRWLVTKDSFVAYVRPSDGHIRAVMLADADFDAKWGIEETNLNTGLIISNQYRKLLVKCDSVQMARHWMVEIMEMISKSEYTEERRFSAFGPERTDTYARWFVDGSKYFDALADAMEGAEQEIFITDWWLNAEIYLKRPAVEGPHWRLDNILRRKAASGVKIFILLYKEVDVALDLGSKHTKHVLMDLHPNIKVMRHPDHNPGQVILWAHHEKLVVVDQKVAFVGGLDICYGRWDDFKHRLADTGSALVANKNASLPRQQRPPPSPRTPTSPEPEDEGGYFRRPRLKSATAYLMNPIRRLRQEETQTSVDENLDKLGLSGTPKLWIGKDYCNFIAKDVLAPEESLQDSVDRMKTPRMPWHDIGTCLYGRVAADVARHFIQRWNFTKKEKAERLNHYPLLLPKSTSSIEVKEEHKTNSVPCNCQLLRSASKWSVGVKHTEDSIQKAYIKLIGEAKHYIYIENQFFITLPDSEVTNGIAQALYQRILRAYEERETFRVYVFLPLLPAFQGDVGEAGGGAIHAILHWEYQSICRGSKSLIGRLMKAGVSDVREYITFYGLRTHDTLNGELVTELVYIHSKLMIVDDRAFICGSANINDRSLLGKRDSELAVLVEDTEMIPSRMNGEEYMAGKLAFGLREWLFKEHLGVLQGHGEIDMTDPVSDSFYKGVVMKLASDNTVIFELVFRCLPSNSVTSSAVLQEFKKVTPLCKTDPKAALRLLKDIHGYITWIPLDFLKDENLQPKLTSQEGIAPTKLWT
ncbi:phospholipase D1-like isoform X2 [Acanthaster planci]|uniref:Phospholipase n=1 Tax=Acanthaster planci TaxID=133434 RepID=A0A8B7ZKH1_ACAPL|nr:phospholipase D1-like isoform X2 [Acanthaster planci]